MRRPPAGSTKDSRKVSDFKVTGPRGARPPRGQQKGPAEVTRLKAPGPPRAARAERNRDDIAPGRQQVFRRGAALFANPFKGAGPGGRVGKPPPHQAPVDDRK